MSDTSNEFEVLSDYAAQEGDVSYQQLKKGDIVHLTQRQIVWSTVEKDGHILKVPSGMLRKCVKGGAAPQITQHGKVIKTTEIKPAVVTPQTSVFGIRYGQIIGIQKDPTIGKPIIDVPQPPIVDVPKPPVIPKAPSNAAPVPQPKPEPAITRPKEKEQTPQIDQENQNQLQDVFKKSLHITNLSPYVTEDELKSFFKSYGVVRCTIPNNQPLDQPRFAYADFANENDAAIALDFGNGKDIKGYDMHIQYYSKNQQSSTNIWQPTESTVSQQQVHVVQSQSRSQTICIRNLSVDLRVSEVKSLLEPFNPLSVNAYEDTSDITTYLVVAEFADEEQAREAVNFADGLNVKGKTISAEMELYV
ncbi:MAG: hypothetical protein EZS28_013005 [Streblomastix strix]|uniref:RRM domain-containing protein n=1 Tax=Streblomastix strix TaxID=222440 RepID=A0A5J4WAC5_9EUKA|nr:MAG: hypothetical protein EZS28_013005 [Streblomastix strix]